MTKWASFVLVRFSVLLMGEQTQLALDHLPSLLNMGRRPAQDLIGRSHLIDLVESNWYNGIKGGDRDARD